MKSGIMQEMDRLCLLAERRIRYLERRVTELELENGRLIAAYVQAADRSYEQTVRLAIEQANSTGGNK